MCCNKHICQAQIMVWEYSKTEVFQHISYRNKVAVTKLLCSLCGARIISGRCGKKLFESPVSSHKHTQCPTGILKKYIFYKVQAAGECGSPSVAITPEWQHEQMVQIGQHPSHKNTFTNSLNSIFHKPPANQE